MQNVVCGRWWGYTFTFITYGPSQCMAQSDMSPFIMAVDIIYTVNTSLQRRALTGSRRHVLVYDRVGDSGGYRLRIPLPCRRRRRPRTGFSFACRIYGSRKSNLSTKKHESLFSVSVLCSISVQTNQPRLRIQLRVPQACGKLPKTIKDSPEIISDLHNSQGQRNRSGRSGYGRTTFQRSSNQYS